MSGAPTRSLPTGLWRGPNGTAVERRRSAAELILRVGLSLVFLAAGSCSDFPRDPEGTLDRVRAERSFRVGLVAPISGTDPRVDALLRRVAKVSGARGRVERGDAEPLLTRLEEGDLDLVIGRFKTASPWKRKVSFSPPLRIEKHGKTKFQLVAAMRNGENAWIGLVEREAREVGEPAR